MILDTTSKTVEIVLGGAKTTNDCEFTADFADTASGTTFVPGGNIGLTNGVTAVTAVAAPGGSVQRHVKALTVYNADTVNTTVTVRIFDGTNRRRIVSLTLTPGQSLVYTPEVGWSILPSLNGQIPGTQTNDNAAAGNDGEYISGVLASGSPLVLVSSTQTNITSMSLTPGDWEVTGVVKYTLGSGTPSITELDSSISTTSATIDTTTERFGQNVYPGGQAVVNVNNVGIFCGASRFSLSVTTTIFLVGRAIWTTGGVSAFGTVRARRAR